MKKIALFMSMALAAVSTLMATPMSQNDSSLFSGWWSTTSTPALKVDQKYYDNWSASGNSSLALTATFNGDYKYTHKKFIWDNIVDLAFGYNWQDLVVDTTYTDKGFDKFDSRRKSDDKIDLTSTFSMRMKNDWNVNASANFKTQFGAGFNYPTVNDSDRVEVSGFMAPAYLTTSIGFEHKKDNWNIALSFLTGKTTFVCNDSLIAQGYDYGVIQKNANPAVDGYTHAYFGLGSYVKFYYKKDIAKNLNFYTRVELFYDYRKPGLLDWQTLDDQLAAGTISQAKYDEMNDRGWLGKRAFETDFDWELALTYHFSSWLAANFSVNMKYDTDFSGMGRLGRWQMYQSAGVQIYFNWKHDQQH